MIDPFVLLLLQAFWFIAPAYAANAFPPIIKGKKPLDFGKNISKHRLLGDGKTFEGTIAGILFGMIIGSIQIYGQAYIPSEFGLIDMTVPLVFLLACGAISGDIVGAFIKRRFNIKRGNPAPLLDQLDFLVFAIIFANYMIDINLQIVLVLLILTPIIHWIANLIGYYGRVKKTPW